MIHLCVQTTAAPELFDTLLKHLRHYNQQTYKDELAHPLSVAAYDEQQQLIGGICGRTVYNQLLIEILWVDPAYRAPGIGQQLLLQLEQQALLRGCLAAQVDTLSFQAPDFYQKYVYEIAGKISQVANSPTRYFLVKHFSADRPT